MSGKDEKRYTEEFEKVQKEQSRELLKFFGTIIATGFTVIALASLAAPIL